MIFCSEIRSTILNASRALSNRVRRLNLSFHRRFRGLQVPRDKLDVIVVSPGGVGTTAIIRHLNKHVRVNFTSDSDGYKHMPTPPEDLDFRGERYIYIKGDAHQIYRSIRRRGWVDIQGAKLGSPMSVLTWGSYQERFFIRAVTRQIRAWSACEGPSVLMLDYDDVWDSADRIASFLAVDPVLFGEEFPERQKRSVTQ